MRSSWRTDSYTCHISKLQLLRAGLHITNVWKLEDSDDLVADDLVQSAVSLGQLECDEAPNVPAPLGSQDAVEAEAAKWAFEWQVHDSAGCVGENLYMRQPTFA